MNSKKHLPAVKVPADKCELEPVSLQFKLNSGSVLSYRQSPSQEMATEGKCLHILLMKSLKAPLYSKPCRYTNIHTPLHHP